LYIKKKIKIFFFTVFFIFFLHRCDDIIPIDQISKEVATVFNWHPWSIMTSEENRPKRTPGSIAIDV